MPEQRPVFILSTPADAAVLLRDQRLLEGHSQLDLAEAIGTQQSAVSDWESGECEPLLGNLMTWAATLGFQVALTPFDNPNLEATIADELALAFENRKTSSVVVL